MRKTVLAAFLCVAVMLAATPAFAGKVGFVDLQKVLDLTKMGKEISTQIAALTDEWKIKVKKAELKVVTLRDELQKTEAALSDEAKKKKLQELQNLMMEYQQLYLYHIHYYLLNYYYSVQRKKGPLLDNPPIHNKNHLNPQYICFNCGRVADSAQNLCNPMPLKD